MNTIKNDTSLIAYCGLYCGACKSYIKGKCPGCAGNEKASWCEIRKCCMTNNIKSCADCKEFTDVKQCKKYNNFIAKAIGFVLRSDRPACIEMIKNDGYENFATFMSSNGYQTIRRK